MKDESASLDKLKLEIREFRSSFSIFNFLKNLFIYFYFWLPWVFVAVCGRFSSCSEWGLLFVVVLRLLIGWLLLLQSTGSRHAGFSSCGTRAQ